MPRPRISILTAILLTTIVAMSIVIAQFWREIGPLRAEVRSLRNETGRLSIADPTKLYSIEVRTQVERAWKWRVWVPQGETAMVHVQWGKVPKAGVPPSSGSIQLESGEHWITLAAAFDPKSNYWTSQLATETGSVGSMIQPDEHWFDFRQCAAVSDGVSTYSAEAKPGQNVFVLKRYRAAPVSSSANIPADPTPGFIIWLDRQ